MEDYAVNKKELIEEIAEKSGLKKVEAERALAAFEEAIVTNLKKGERIAIVGFGTFTVKESKERTGRNPKTGESVLISAKKTPKFLAAKQFKESVDC